MFLPSCPHKGGTFGCNISQHISSDSTIVLSVSCALRRGMLSAFLLTTFLKQFIIHYREYGLQYELSKASSNNALRLVRAVHICNPRCSFESCFAKKTCWRSDCWNMTLPETVFTLCIIIPLPPPLPGTVCVARDLRICAISRSRCAVGRSLVDAPTTDCSGRWWHTRICAADIKRCAVECR